MHSLRESGERVRVVVRAQAWTRSQPRKADFKHIYRTFVQNNYQNTGVQKENTYLLR